MLYSTLQAEVSLVDFAHVCSLFSGHNAKVLKQKITIQQNKFNNLLKDRKSQHDPEKIIFNYSSYIISDAEKSLLLFVPLGSLSRRVRFHKDKN